MERDEMIAGMTKELAKVRSDMERMGPIALGTLARSSKKYRTKDGKEHKCRDMAVLKFAGSGAGRTMRIPADKEKIVGEMLENGRKWRDLNKRCIMLMSQLAVHGALKKTTRDADTEVCESHGDSGSGKRSGKRHGVGRSRGENRSRGEKRGD